MNIEIEIKVRVANLDSAREIIRKIGTFVKQVNQVDTYFVPKDNDYFALERVVEFLRIREQEGKDEVAYHKVIGLDTAEEHSQEFESTISNPEIMKGIFSKIGMIERFVVRKQREYYECGDFEVVLDTVDDLGEFIEVEVIAKNREEFTKESCHDFLTKNGIGFRENIIYGYPELLKLKEQGKFE